MTKTLNCTAIVSDDVCINAGVRPEAMKRTEVAIRGRDQAMIVYAVADTTQFASLLERQAREFEPEAAISA